MIYSKKRSRESRAAIERLYITMRHLIIRGNFKPNGVSGEQLSEALLSLSPEIYGSINDPEKVELDGLLYVAERLPMGIEECRFVHLVAREGLHEAGHDIIIPLKRRRNCYRVDKDRMFVEMSRGRSDIYDILTHLTFLNIEAEKLKRQGLDHKGKIKNVWKRLEEVVNFKKADEEFDEKRALIYLSSILGRTVEETKVAVDKFEHSQGSNSLYHLVYWLGQVAINDQKNGEKKEIVFSAKLREVIGHHVYGEQWAQNIKSRLDENDLLKRDIHVISANLHSIANSLYGFAALDEKFKDFQELAFFTNSNREASRKIMAFAREHGLMQVEDNSGTNLGIQIIDLNAVPWENHPLQKHAKNDLPVLLVMDYAFGEQAFECMDELLKPYVKAGKNHALNFKSVSVMGKAGILQGKKGDLMIPTAHVFEGTADNYPIENDLSPDDFKESDMAIYEGTMVTVLGTSLQNRDVLHHFLTSTWNAVGLEMEGAHYQKAVQSAARIRKSVNKDITVRYAYYASDNPLETGSTLSSGSLGAEGVKPTYWITFKILEKIMQSTA